LSAIPQKKNIRKALNFGHTLGHAIESYFLENDTKITLLHGEAIAAGMV
jgi:3-dehydroquinate synthase